jgi:cell division protein FtsI (penicillin-binding protein 3)
MFNPNDREHSGRGYRNLAMLDTFEPGSSFKPFWVAEALEEGKITADSVIDTGNGTLGGFGPKLIKDEHPIGAAPLWLCLAKSSNVALTKIGMMVDRQRVYSLLRNLGIGSISEVQYPGEPGGTLHHFTKWKPVDVSAMSRGYYVSVTPFQLASAYTTSPPDISAN